MLLKYKYALLKSILKKKLLKSNSQDLFFEKPLVYYSTQIGNYFLPADAPDDNIALEMRRGKIFEPEVVDAASQYIKKDSIVLDIGANFGQMSLLFSEMVGEKGKVYAFEANKYVFHILRKNINANDANNIRPFYRAVYNTSDELLSFPDPDFIKYKAYGSYGLNPEINEGEKVKTITIDSLTFDLPISLMKVDIQGADLFALQGAYETIKKHQMPIIFEYEEQFQELFNTTFNDYVDFIKSIDYKFIKTINEINFIAVPKEPKEFAFTENNNVVDTDNETKPNLCKFLKTEKEIDESTLFMYENGLYSHDLVCKNWDLSNIIPNIADGRFLDMGSSDSFILKNLSINGFKGELFGIDLRKPNIPLYNVNYTVGDLMKTDFPDNYFKHISCLSVIEHEVDYEKFAAEVSRILDINGSLYLTFDYWEPKVNTNIELFGLKWNILDKADVTKLISVLESYKLTPVENIDWAIEKPVINERFGSPDKKYKYTFGMIVFIKRS